MNNTRSQTSIPSEQWCLGEPICNHEIEPKYANLKVEVLCNEFTKLSKIQWNDTLKKSQFILQQQKFGSFLELKEVIALKLYCDFDSLQCEYTKCYRPPYNQNKSRLSSFYWWNKILSSAMKKLSNSPTKFDNKRFKSVYHGVSSVMKLKNINDQIHKYYGPLSTTTDIFVARSMAGSKGMIIEIQFPDSDNRDLPSPINVSQLSAFPEEHEILCFNQSIYVKKVMLSSEFDSFKYLQDA
eukprot:CAMPEP_0201575490 /NCGR_PEP_ID=MMETSP0190_2-20130828/20709_1 /ASSEMBLY_ACC=CAM_ASM_000263 /TAXON_ID=37353 /ORGANISM="Rosalina sp." /LENGTH=239 /DNA_ID=CAMNT_0048005165 /DNA_START=89 /DNA_END=808 /DNA_ORIENTATION=+